MGLLEAFLRKKRTDDDGEVVKNKNFRYIVLELETIFWLKFFYILTACLICLKILKEEKY